MNIEQAKLLKPGDKVWVTYTPAKGHGYSINHPGVVSYTSGEQSEVIKNNAGTEYIWVTVCIPSILVNSVFPSWCIAKL